MPLRFLLVATLVAGTVARADQGVRRDGERVSGTLALTPAGTFAFRDGDREVTVAELDLVRFDVKQPSGTAR
jgi:hypothetical protein